MEETTKEWQKDRDGGKDGGGKGYVNVGRGEYTFSVLAPLLLQLNLLDRLSRNPLFIEPSTPTLASIWV